ncbi:ATP-binding protein [Lysinibacillus telephonicus]|uniref:ATP-binding protein n=1 Tax=Lysinibacillus telephonicus TaxID=1714840 RepID=UPI001FE9FF06|nr:ATP-binding protein [Lysinibacillus telephonicus]
MRILLDDESPHTFGLKISEINTASAIYVNGKLVGGAGLPSSNSDLHENNKIPYSVSFGPKENEVDILIHVSSKFNEGGIIKPLRFGTIEAITYRNNLSIGMQLLFCAVLIIHGVYALILYVIGANPNKGLLYFSLILFSALITVLGADDKLLYRVFEINYVWGAKLTFLSYIGVAAFIPHLIKNLFPIEGYLKILRWYSLYCALYAIFILLAPLEYALHTITILGTVLLLSIIVSVILLKNTNKEIEESIYLLISCLSIGVNIVWVIIHGRLSLEYIHYPFDLIFAILAFAALWFKRFFLVTSKAEQLAEKLKLENTRKDDFLVNTSHELRNPLHGIINIIQSILDDRKTPPSEEHKKRLGIIMKVSKRMSLMLNDLLDVTRLREKTIQLQLGRVQLHSVVAGVVDMIKLMLDGKPIRLQVCIPDTFPAVLADENRIIQVLFNLVHNAVKFTDEGTVTIHVYIENKKAYIVVEDTGIGIEKEALQTIFHPYEQASINSSSERGGFGLGLSICKQLVELHNGTLTVESTPGKGSAFTFTLPLFEVSEVEEENYIINLLKESINTIAATTELSTQIETRNDYNVNQELKPKILAVDDDNINLNILISLLGEEYEVTAVSSAKQALEKLKVEQYDLVISDVMMPHVSGFELTRIIRKQFTLSELPILLLTARTRSEDMLTGFHAGANDYVTKPIDSWELKVRVQVLIKLKQSIEERVRMEGAWLQSQIKPHFLFNVLNSISALGTIDTNKMQELLEEFSNYLRFSIDFNNAAPLVSLESELSLVRSYLYIESVRFGDRLRVRWEIDDSIEIQVPPLSIQPLVENAVIHGILDRKDGGEVCIRVRRQLDCIEISIIDDGKGMTEAEFEQLFMNKSDSKVRKSIGLKNIDRRLKQLFGKGLQIVSSYNKGTTITFYIPIKKEIGEITFP